MGASYVDNIGVFSLSRAAADRTLNAVVDDLRCRGLILHEIEPASPHGDFVGLCFDGVRGMVRIKPSRIWRLAYALDEALARPSLSGGALEVLLGHVTWAGLVRREILSVLNVSYRYVKTCHDWPATLWPAVRRELQQVKSLLPLLRADLRGKWHDKMIAPDASHFGLGVCERGDCRDMAASLGGVSERWRFAVEDAVRACAHAFSEPGAAGPVETSSDSLLALAATIGKGLSEGLGDIGGQDSSGWHAQRGRRQASESCVGSEGAA